jgi:endonuclease-8
LILALQNWHKIVALFTEIIISMPEGPSIVILKEKVTSFKEKNIVTASGSSNINFDKLAGEKIIDFKSWGKHLLICFKGYFIRIHLLMFGTYLINNRKVVPPKLSLRFSDGELNFYTCHVLLIEKEAAKMYNWETDIMSDNWSAVRAQEAISSSQKEKICDVLLDQEKFSGVGNIIKNEALFRAAIHPESTAGFIPTEKIKELVNEVRQYSLDFYKWKKINQLSRYWFVYHQKTCPRCQLPINSKKTGKGKRLSYYCNNCQVVYENKKNLYEKNSIV